jgi:hypothetical protein
VAPLPRLAAGQVDPDPARLIAIRRAVRRSFRDDPDEATPARTLGNRLEQDRAIDGSQEAVRPVARQRPDRGPHEQLERHEARDRVAGQGEQERRPAVGPFRGPERERLAGLDRDPPDVDPADLLDGDLDDVVRPDRHAARDDDRVCATGQRGAQPRLDVFEPIFCDPEGLRLRAGVGDERGDAGAVRVGNARGTQVVPGGNHLVAGRQDRDARPAVDRQLRDAGPGREGDRLGTQRASGLEHRDSPRQVAAGPPDRPADGNGLVDKTRGREWARRVAPPRTGGAVAVEWRRGLDRDDGRGPAGIGAPVAIRTAVPRRTSTSVPSRGDVADDLEPDRASSVAASTSAARIA